MDYREIGKNLKFETHLRAIPKEFTSEWKSIIKQLVFAPFVKQLEPHPDATETYDTFIIIHKDTHFIIRMDEYNTQVFFSNSYPFFLNELDNNPNCHLHNPTAVSVSKLSDYMVLSAVGYSQLVKALVEKQFISKSKAAYLLDCLTFYQKSILNEVDIQLLETEYYRHVWSLYHTALKLGDLKFYGSEFGIVVQRFLDSPAVIVQCNTYQEVYILNKEKKMFVIPLDDGGNNVAFMNSHKFKIEKLLEAVDSPLFEYQNPLGSFVSVIDFNGAPYTLKGVNPNFLQAHQVTLYSIYNEISQSAKS